MADFSISFAPEALAEIIRMSSFPAYLSPEMSTAMDEGTQLLTEAAIANTWAYFANPSGQLAGTIHPDLSSPYEASVVVDSPYGHRRDQGFVGADSLGRVYNDQGYFYLTNAFNDNEQAVLQKFDDAIQRALARIANG